MSRFREYGLVATAIAIFAINAVAQGKEAQYEFHIEEKTLGDALDNLARTTGLQLVYPHDLARMTGVNPVHDQCTIEAALAVMLRGMNLSGGLTESGVIVVSLEKVKRQRQEGEVASGNLRKGFMASVMTFVLGASAQAAETADSGPSEQAKDKDTIVVTARKREESMQDVPIAISAFSQGALNDIGAHELVDFLELSPGVSLVADSGFQQLAIRGVSTTLGGNANGYYLDNVPFTGVNVPWNPNVQSFDLDRVEVLRGPQGTLFGEGSMGGTVRIVTKSPQTDAFHAGVDSSVSSTKEGDTSYTVRGMVNIPLIEDKVAFRAVGIQEEYSGWIDVIGGENNINDSNLTTFRGKLLITPTDKLKIEGSAWIHDQDLASDNNALDGDVVNTPGAAVGQGYDQYSAFISYDFGVLNASYAFGQNNLGYDVASDIAGLGTFEAEIDIDVRTHEFLLNGDVGSRLVWTAGYYNRLADRDEKLLLPAAALDKVANIISDAWAVFGEAEYSFTNQVRLAVGLRYFKEDLSSTDAGQYYGSPIGEHISESYDSVNPRVVLTVEPSESHLIYASAAKGFRGGQLQPSTSLAVAEALNIDLPSNVAADTIWTYELGSKHQFWDNRLQVEAAFYYSDWSDPAIRYDLIPGVLNGIFNAEGTKTFGFEFGGVARPTDSLTLQGGVSIIDAEFKSDVAGTPIKKGDTPQNVSDLTWNASALYRRPAFGQFNLFARAGATFSSARVNTSSLANTPGDDVFLVDTRIGLEHDNLGIYFFADNILDDDGAWSSRLGSGLANRPRPRTFGVQVRASY